MLAIRLQRLGRSGYPTYRIAVQEAQRHPTSGRVVAYVGSYNPHSKETTLDLEKVSFYLGNGAQPTPRVVKLLTEQKVKLPEWVVTHTGKKQVATKHSDKLRKNRPAEEVAQPVEDVAEEASEAAAEAPVEPADAQDAAE